LAKNQAASIRGLVLYANVRLYLVDNENTRQWYPEYRLLDLGSFEYYHEGIINRGSVQVAFTTETTVRNFQFLEIMFNDDFGVDEYERFYSIRNVLYSINELTPEMPLVITSANLGCALASNGFSFVDEHDIARYFSFIQCGKTGLIFVSEF